ncbi:hypothetical protein TIFTF001_038926 [Ficus carica]|uniref:Uncharacterized protein n=1 Tax=Ficus carica TaxID=3494 RepID=A0AA88E862_FICCA|nr:hypothetical protein TIFTF001_038926 [Ficus carica]
MAEYGMGSKVSIEGDVFSFGILLLEIFTGKKPTDENLDGLSLHQLVKMALPTKVMEIVDQCLLIEGEEESSRSGSTVRIGNERVNECLISVFTIGLMCSEELPRERMKINDALNDLHKIKKMLLKYARNTNRA